MNKSNLHRKIGSGILAAATLAAFAAAPVQAAGAERSLAGIAIFAPGSSVTKKFGNPNQILVGGVAPPPFTPAGVSGAGIGGPGGQGGFPGGQGGFPGAAGGQGGFSGSQGGFPGSQGGYPGSDGGTGSLPGFPGAAGGQGGFPGSGGGFPGSGGGFPGAPGGFPGGATGFSGGSPGTVAPTKPPVTLVYNRANGGSLEFTISPDKRVVQIRETGYLGTYGTARGIKLGTSYSAVVARYGYPENTDLAGPIVNIDYRSTLHCGFQFLDQKLVGIIVSSPE